MRLGPFLLAWAFLSSAASAQMPEPDIGPRARDLYVGCSLAMRLVDIPSTPAEAAPPFSGQACGRVALPTFFQAGPRVGEPYSWCPPDSAGISVEEWRPMIRTFLIYFERHAADVADRDGGTVWIEALRERWPCPAPRGP